MAVCQVFLHVWLSIWSRENSFAKAVSSGQMALCMHQDLRSPAGFRVYLQTLQRQT